MGAINQQQINQLQQLLPNLTAQLSGEHSPGGHRRSPSRHSQYSIPGLGQTTGFNSPQPPPPNNYNQYPDMTLPPPPFPHGLAPPPPPPPHFSMAWPLPPATPLVKEGTSDMEDQLASRLWKRENMLEEILTKMPSWS